MACDYSTGSCYDLLLLSLVADVEETIRCIEGECTGEFAPRKVVLDSAILQFSLKQKALPKEGCGGKLIPPSFVEALSFK